MQANYLDLDILVNENDDRLFTHKLYNKRDAFPFKVIGYTSLQSNTPINPSYGIVTSQLLRVARVSSSVEDFNAAAAKLINDLLSSGYKKDKLRKKFDQFIYNKNKEWGKFGFMPSTPDSIT